ncbi:hypothetical protein KIPB_007870 [Kipferlia bialata]|uniref:Uncharacterized protein n=1 Tax=Kipferlia bialata TaxID=797122 RepID=A0A391P441_9EUKA|nr:hypothetical protein KIPB_007870 [Kipferlia bialata]|eukprot:g7870.t1
MITTRVTPVAGMVKPGNFPMSPKYTLYYRACSACHSHNRIQSPQQQFSLIALSYTQRSILYQCSWDMS